MTVRRSLPGVRSRAFWILVGVALVVVVAAWLSIRGGLAYVHLRAARSGVSGLEQALRDDDLPVAREQLAAMGDDTRAARGLTGDPVWAGLSHVPWVGDMPAAVHDVAAAVDVAVRGAGPPALDAYEAVDPRTLIGADGSIDVTRIEAAAPDVRQASIAASRARSLAEAAGGSLVGPVRRSVEDAQRQVVQLADALAAARTATEVAPSMLGSEGARRYLMAVQNPAEARGTGGLLGAYAIATVRAGKVSVGTIGAKSDLEDAPKPVVSLGSDFADLYGNDPGLWANANLSPHFPYAAKLWLGLWQRQHGVALDGVLAVDPFVMGNLVGATAPIELSDGTILNAENTASFIMSTMYERYPAYGQERQRDRLASEVGGRVIQSVLGGDVDASALVQGVAQAADEGRIHLFSRHPDEQGLLRSTSIGGVTPSGPGPYLQVVIDNGGGNKLDYYLDRRVRWQLGPCEGPNRRSRVTITVHNDATGDLPAYVLGEPIVSADGDPAAPGTNRLLVYVHTTEGSRLRGGELDGGSLKARTGVERGHPVVAFTVDLAPGQTRKVVLDLSEPSLPGTPQLADQALVRPLRSVTEAATCAMIPRMDHSALTGA